MLYVKKGLTVLLAMVMVLSAMVVPTVAAVTNNYSYTFEETDLRNQHENQVIDITAEAEGTFTVDGVKSESEPYGYKHTLSANGNRERTVDAYFGVQGNKLYMAVLAEERFVGSSQLFFGVMNENDNFHVIGDKILVETKSNGDFKQTISYVCSREGYNGSRYDVNYPLSWGIGNGKHNYLDKSVIVNSNGVTTYEYCIDLADLCYWYSGFVGQDFDSVWNSRVFGFGYVNSTTDKGGYYYSEATPSLMNEVSGNTLLGWTYCMYTIIVPESMSDYKYDTEYKYVEDFEYQSIADLSAHGQKVDTAYNVGAAAMDGVITPGEYSASMRFDDEDMTSKTDRSAYFGGTTLYATETEDYIYLAGAVEDKYWVADKSYLTFYINVPDSLYDIEQLGQFYNITLTANSSKKVGVKSIGTSHNHTNWDGTTTAVTVGSDLRPDLDPSWQAAFGRDEENDITTYEMKLSKARLRKIFQLPEDFDIGLLMIRNDIYVAKDSAGSACDYIQNHLTINSSTIGSANWNNLLYQLNWLRHRHHGFKSSTTKLFPWAGMPTATPHAFLFEDGMETLTTASARIATDPAESGLRFKTVYSNDYLAALKAKAAGLGKELNIGTLIVPEEYVKDGACEFTKAALEAKYTIPYLDVTAYVDHPFETNDDTSTYAGSIVKILKFDRNFSAKGYAQIGDDIIYSSTSATRNIQAIASDAIEDTVPTQRDGYTNEISAGVWSPYTKEQLAMIKMFVSN